MSILSTAAIQRRLRDPDLQKRLFILPILETTEQLREDQACIDIRLGTEFRVPIPARGDSIDALEPPAGLRDVPYERYYVPLGGYIVAHPHQLILGQSLEYMRFPNDLGGYVISRSSWGRRGLIVATAIGIHPGFAGILTLELRNLGDLPLRLYPADTIAQVVVHRVEEPSETTESFSQFAGATAPGLGRVRYSTTEMKLRALAERYQKKFVTRRGGPM